MINYNDLRPIDNRVIIDIVSDVVCPWCIVGYKRLAQAIQEMGIEDKVEINWQPFELNPDMPPEGENVMEHLMRKYRSSAEEMNKSRAHLTQMGAELGVIFDYNDNMRMVNTFYAHVLLDYAKEHGKQTELNLRFVTAYFTHGVDVSNRELLLKEVERVGLNKEEARACLDDPARHARIKTEVAQWQSRGVRSVPTVVFNNTSGLTGAQPVSVYKQVLSEMLGK